MDIATYNGYNIGQSYSGAVNNTNSPFTQQPPIIAIRGPEGGSSMRKGLNRAFKNPFSFLKTLNKLSQVFGLGLPKCFYVKNRSYCIHNNFVRQRKD